MVALMLELQHRPLRIALVLLSLATVAYFIGCILTDAPIYWAAKLVPGIVLLTAAILSYRERRKSR